jgi:hypothetical protein
MQKAASATVCVFIGNSGEGGSGRKPVAIVLDLARVYCAKCNATRQVRVGFADQMEYYLRHVGSYEFMPLSRLLHHARRSGG